MKFYHTAGQGYVNAPECTTARQSATRPRGAVEGLTEYRALTPSPVGRRWAILRNTHGKFMARPPTG